MTTCDCGDEDRPGWTHTIGAYCIPDEALLVAARRYRRTTGQPEAFTDVRPMLEIAADIVVNTRHIAEHAVVSPATDDECRVMLCHGLNPADQQQLRGFRVGQRHPQPAADQCFDAHAYEEYGL